MGIDIAQRGTVLAIIQEQLAIRPDRGEVVSTSREADVLNKLRVSADRLEGMRGHHDSVKIPI